MGYYTSYTLKTLNSDVSIEGILSELKTLDFDIFPIGNILEEIDYAMDSEGNPISFSKWYEHEEDMKTISRMYPDIVFDLYGEGEDMRDIWHKYFMNEKMQYCPGEIIFAGFDPAKLI